MSYGKLEVKTPQGKNFPLYFAEWDGQSLEGIARNFPELINLNIRQRNLFFFGSTIVYDPDPTSMNSKTETIIPGQTLVKYLNHFEITSSEKFRARFLEAS
jgi:hypothetical protein